MRATNDPSQLFFSLAAMKKKLFHYSLKRIIHCGCGMERRASVDESLFEMKNNAFASVLHKTCNECVLTVYDMKYNASFNYI